MLVVWKRADAFNRTSKVSTWIFAIAYRKALKALRQQDEPVDGVDDDEPPSDDAGAGAAAAHRPDPRRPAARAEGCRRSSARSRPDLLPRLAVRRDRAHRRLPGRHRQDAHVPRPPAPAYAAPRRAGEAREGARAAARQRASTGWRRSCCRGSSTGRSTPPRRRRSRRISRSARAAGPSLGARGDACGAARRRSGGAVERGWAALRGRLDARPTDARRRQRSPGLGPGLRSHLPPRPSSCWSWPAPWSRTTARAEPYRALGSTPAARRGECARRLSRRRDRAADARRACVPPARASSAARRHRRLPAAPGRSPTRGAGAAARRNPACCGSSRCRRCDAMRALVVAALLFGLVAASARAADGDGAGAPAEQRAPGAGAAELAAGALSPRRQLRRRLRRRGRRATGARIAAALARSNGLSLVTDWPLPSSASTATSWTCRRRSASTTSRSGWRATRASPGRSR